MYVTKDSLNPQLCQRIAVSTVVKSHILVMYVTTDSLDPHTCHAISAFTVGKSQMHVMCATRDLVKMEAWYHI